MKRSMALSRFVFYSLLGIFMFFVPITVGGKSSIPLDHLVGYILKIPNYRMVYGLLLCIVGAILPFVLGTWKSSKMKIFFSIINLTAIPFVLMAVLHKGPEGLLTKDMIPFIYGKIVVPVATIVPIGSVFLAFIISYGLMEFVGVFMRPIMKPIFHTPGRSAIDAVASFVGSYSIALLITNGVYRDGKYTDKEACIIATGFSTVSATFMIIVAKSLGFMNEYWLLYFWVTVVITFLVTAITSRLYPLAQKREEYFENRMGEVEKDIPKGKCKAAIEEAIRVSSGAPSLQENIVKNLKDGLHLAFSIAPSLMAVGTIGLILAKYTPVFDFVAYIFYPFTALMQLPDAFLTAKALSMSIAEMFLPVIPIADCSIVTKFVVAVTCVSEILFFSASIPCMMATDIPLKLKDYFIIWFERVALSILLAGLAAQLLF